MGQSRVANVSIPEVDLWTFLFERKSKPFLDNQVIYTCSESGRQYTYNNVRKTASQFGSAMTKYWAWQKNDVLAVFSPNSIDTPAIIWGCQWAGGIVSPANPGYTSAELTLHLRDSGAKALLTVKGLLSTALEAMEAAGLSKSRILLIGNEEDECGQVNHFTSLLQFADPNQSRVIINPSTDLAFLVYSSGTTGLPKAVMLSHTNIVSNLAMVNTVDGEMLKSGRDRILSVLPYYHIYGLMFLVHLPIYIGVESVVLARFDIQRFCSIIQSHRITYTYVAPPIVLRLAKDALVDNYDLSSLRMITSGAAPLTRELIIAVYDRLGIPTKQAYGLSETSPATHVQSWDSWKTALGSVGQALPNLIVKYVDANGTEAPEGSAGEIWIKGPTVFKGYLNNPRATSEAITEDGYFRTGDIGFEDKNGNMFITDRMKELIKYKGSQVAPAELEGVLTCHPKVKDAAIVGTYVAAIASEVPLGYVVPMPGTTTDEATAMEIVDWLATQVVKTKQLRGGIVWIDDIPKSASGKILRRVLKVNSKSAKPMAAFKFCSPREGPKL
ncbi:hypothetical protein V491_09446 [Pseudogymnoascus sp. VKM F-3775]|nr:hypothetical protein V491_09446 [Pseudogymnoascus sp. VKM F-3775]